MTNVTLDTKLEDKKEDKTMHQKKAICMIDHVHKDNKSPVAKSTMMNVYCPEYKIQYTRPMTPAEKKAYR